MVTFLFERRWFGISIVSLERTTHVEKSRDFDVSLLFLFLLPFVLHTRMKEFCNELKGENLHFDEVLSDYTEDRLPLVTSLNLMKLKKGLRTNYGEKKKFQKLTKLFCVRPNFTFYNS